MANLKTTSILALLAFAAGTAGAHAESAGISGKWVIGDGDGIVKIEDGEWTHSEKGVASIHRARGAASWEVHYHRHESIRCRYRITLVDFGQIMMLEPVTQIQSREFCPVGKLTRVSNK